MARNPSNSCRVLLALALSVLLICAVPATARAEMEDFPIVKLQTLDKTTARTGTFEARVGSTVKFGPLYIKTQACRKAPPIEQPESAAFLQIWEVTPQEKAKWVFSGWMFASSPALSPMDHPIYDVWVIDCIADEPVAETPVEGAEEEAASDDAAPEDSQPVTEPLPEEAAAGD